MKYRLNVHLLSNMRLFEVLPCGHTGTPLCINDVAGVEDGAI
jgi:hypothetical protein